MGLTNTSTGAGVMTAGLRIIKETPRDKVVALAGNPNVGKSTVFNGLTGLNQHTGNWPGKTVTNACGTYHFNDQNIILVDLPGTYSLMANSAEEEAARDFICFGSPDAVVVVADATCLERNLNLVLQVMEMTRGVVLCVNLMDEAKKKKIYIDLALLSEKLGIPVVGTSARAGKGLKELMETVRALTEGDERAAPFVIDYGTAIEGALATLTSAVESELGSRIHSRWLALKLLEGDLSLIESVKDYLGYDILQNERIQFELTRARVRLEMAGVSPEQFRDCVVTRIVKTCEEIGRGVLTYGEKNYAARDRKLDRILTSKLTGIPIMILLLFGVFWLTDHRGQLSILSFGGRVVLD